jgi:hypothetical protein
MLVEEFVLINRHIVVARHVAFIGVRAGVTNDNALEFYDCLFGAGQFVILDDLISQVRNVNACVAFPRHVKVVFLQVGKLDEESKESL